MGLTNMAISIFTLLTVAHVAVAVVACGGGSVLRRRLRGAGLVQVVATVGAAVLIPANVYCAFNHRAIAAQGADALAVCVTVGSLTALCAVGVLVMARRIPRTPARLARRVLAVGAHPDDLELACGGTIAKLADSGHEVHALVMSHGGRGTARLAAARQ